MDREALKERYWALIAEPTFLNIEDITQDPQVREMVAKLLKWTDEITISNLFRVSTSIVRCSRNKYWKYIWWNASTQIQVKTLVVDKSIQNHILEQVKKFVLQNRWKIFTREDIFWHIWTTVDIHYLINFINYCFKRDWLWVIKSMWKKLWYRWNYTYTESMEEFLKVQKRFENNVA